jgi:hypothetical protein
MRVSRGSQVATKACLIFEATVSLRAPERARVERYTRYNKSAIARADGVDAGERPGGGETASRHRRAFAAARGSWEGVTRPGQLTNRSVPERRSGRLPERYPRPVPAPVAAIEIYFSVWFRWRSQPHSNARCANTVTRLARYSPVLLRSLSSRPGSAARTGQVCSRETERDFPGRLQLGVLSVKRVGARASK